MQWNICFKPYSALVTKISKRCTLLDQQHPQRFASALSQRGVSERSDQMYYLRNSMIEIILRGKEGGTCYSRAEERRLCISIVCDDVLNDRTSTLCLKLDKEMES